MQKKLKIGIVGCGAIGSAIAESCQALLKDKFELKVLYDIVKEKSKKLSSFLKEAVIAKSLGEVFNRVDLVIECASGSVSQKIIEKAIEKRKMVLIMSVGGLIDSARLLQKAQKRNIKVYFPSGAICGIDGLKAARLSRIDEITLTTRKPPKGLEGAPYLKEKNIDINSLKGERVLFEGNALEAVKGFPKNVNVASLLSLAGLGAKKTTVQIVSSPAYTKNVHEVKARGDFGEITTKTENVPSDKNPKTSKLAYLSAMATLKGIVENIKIGT